MKNFPFLFAVLIVLLFQASGLQGQSDTQLLRKLKKHLPNASIKALEAKDHFSEAYEILLPQPLDHHNPAAGQFNQLIYLQHTDRKKPMVLETEGYSARFRTNELSRIVQGNLLIVEYRYSGISKPEKMDWKYLTNDQASDDLHR